MKAVQFELLDPLSNREALAQAVALGRQRLGKCSLRRVLKTLHLHRQRLLVVARVEGQLIGFKLGFAERAGVFTSWLGAVDERWEGGGVGRRLMEVQHDELRSRGYHTVRTGTRNRFRRMLILNLRCGFDIAGIKQRRSGEAHIHLEKSLTRNLPSSTEPSPE